jgi:abortive infection bacteriophage resistance protein
MDQAQLQAYTKPFLTVPEQYLRLREQGLRFQDDGSNAIQFLRTVGYYRLSGYWFQFRTPHPTEPIKDGREVRLSSFIPGASWEQVRKLYEFDRSLRRCVFEAMESVEVAIRFRIGHILGQAHPFAHRDPWELSPEFTRRPDISKGSHYSAWFDSNHADWLSELRRLEQRSTEPFVEHFRKTYGGPLPVWVMTEVTTFGALGTLYKGLLQRHQEQIAEDLDITLTSGAGDIGALTSWLENFRYIRNVCGHHSRLWNKNILRQLSEPRMSELRHLRDDSTRSRIYGTLAALAYLMPRLEPGSTWAPDTAAFIRTALANIDQPESAMGFPDGWDDEEIWQTSYRPMDSVRSNMKITRGSFATLTSTEVHQILFATYSSKDRKSALRRIRQRSEILGLQIGESYAYPAFQFDRVNQVVHPIVVEANKRLQSSGRPWEAAQWWSSPAKLPSGHEAVPTKLLRDGLLTSTVLESILPQLSAGVTA